MNPHDMNELLAIDLPALQAMPEYKLAFYVARRIKDGWSYCFERGRWSNWFDQIDRSSTSVLLNIGEAYGKGRGYWAQAYLVARGEAFETAAALDVGPDDLCAELRAYARELIATMNDRLSHIGSEPSSKKNTHRP